MFRMNVGEKELGGFYPGMENLSLSKKDSKLYGYVCGMATLLLNKFI